MDAFLGEIRVFGFNFAPNNWALCNGKPMAVSQYSALYAVIGNTYGGDQNNFLLPDMRARAPIAAGSGPGLTTRTPGQAIGEANVTLIANQIPSHSHGMVMQVAKTSTLVSSSVVAAPQTNSWVSDLYTAVTPSGASVLTAYSTVAPNTALSAASIGPAGGGGGHNNMQPYLAMNFCICISGIFPSPG